jgi:hypothetical protein
MGWRSGCLLEWLTDERNEHLNLRKQVCFKMMNLLKVYNGTNTLRENASDVVELDASRN